MWAVSTLTMLVLAGILPDFRLQSPDGDSATDIAMTAAVGAGAFGLLSALVWPLLVRLLLLVPALVLGLLVFFLNGGLLLLAIDVNPAGRGGVAPETAVVVAAVMSAVASATGGALAVRDDDAYRRRLYRLADRRRRSGPPCPADPGTVFLQLDGVGHDVLLDAVDRGAMPTVARWLGRDGSSATHRLAQWRTDWSSQTGASQLGILHGSNHDVPAFRWYEKDSGEVMVCNRPTSAAELQYRAVRRTGDGGLLSLDGASRGNLFGGGADEQALVLSIATRRRSRETRSRSGYFAYFSDPANAVRTAMSFVAEVCREIGQSTRARVHKVRPRVSRLRLRVAMDSTRACSSAPPPKRLPRLAPSADSSPPSPVYSTARRWSSAALVGRLQTITSPVSFSYQRKAGTSWLLPCRMPSWLAPVWLDQSVRQGVSRCVAAPSASGVRPSHLATVGISPLRTAASRTSWPTPSSWRKTVPGVPGQAGPPRRRRSASRYRRRR